MSENKETGKSEDFRSGYVAVIGRPNVDVYKRQASMTVMAEWNVTV